jgi:hypothetical protein
MYPGGMEEHARPWFTTGALVASIVGAVVDGRQGAILLRNRDFHAPVHLLKVRKLDFSGCDTSLICDDDNFKSRVVQEGDCLD